jgi:hypothetical protein
MKYIKYINREGEALEVKVDRIGGEEQIMDNGYFK